MDYRPPRTMTVDEYKKQHFEQSKRQYFNEKARESSPGRRSFIPGLQLGGETFSTIFGSNVINIVPQGSAELIFSIQNNKTDNPSLQERLRSTTTFDFKQNIQLNVTGNIGDKVSLGINYDTEATFEFENKTNIGYTGDEDEIIQKIEAGNISLPLSGTLITGSQNLFGFKTELKFGNLTVTSVFSQQKGKAETINVEGGAQRQQFDVSVADYEENRHFFLTQYFANKYDEWMKYPQMIRSGIEIKKIEVWVTNKSNNFEESKNIVGFLDIAEANPDDRFNETWSTTATSLEIPSNGQNNLYSSINGNSSLRQIDSLSLILGNYGMTRGIDYERIENARRLNQNEYTINPTLGYISLNFALRNDEVLAVAFEYTYRGKTYKVGELSNNTMTSGNLFLKLIKGTNLNPRIAKGKTWNLMMKNIYSLGAFQVSREDFELYILYKSDEIGTEVPYLPIEKEGINNKLLLQLLNLDNVNSQMDSYPDGRFDFLEGITILANRGRIIFPMREPFGRYLGDSIIKDENIARKYVYNELYDSTKIKANQIADKKKFVIKGDYKSSVGSDIPLNAMNIPKGSVIVTAGGNKLVEGQDYSVDYTLGRLQILNEGLLESGTPIQITLESNQLFNFQTKTMIGTHLDYRVSDNFRLGGTILNLTEKPLTRKVNMGDEPISNTIWGVDGSYSTEVPLLTTLVDKIPFIDTREISRISVEGEFAHLIPGHSRALDKEGVAYIDDFEGSETRIDVRALNRWVLSSTPAQRPEYHADSATSGDSKTYGYHRAMLSWFIIDPLFQRQNPETPDYIKDNPDIQSSHLVREVFEKEIWPERQQIQGLPTNIPVLNLMFDPNERGPYNFNPDLNTDGALKNPEQKWGGIMRSLPTNNFEDANIEFIDFWLMDPFIEENEENTGGELIIHLGDVSEDVLKDERKSFENGLPNFDDEESVYWTHWGRVPKGQSLVNAFDNDPDARLYQDVGLDGLDDQREQDFFNDYLQAIRPILNANTYDGKRADPSKDNFVHYRDQEFDNRQAGILERYRYYNGMDGNSPASEQTTTSYNQSSYTTPDVEDINNDNTLDDHEAYLFYELNLTPNSMSVEEHPYIMDKVSYTASFANGEESAVDWYHFRIPIREGQSFNGKDDLSSIRFMRMMLTGWTDPIVLRFATLNLIRSEWRKYDLPLTTGGETTLYPEPAESDFDLGVVNIEENNSKTPINYILPPGIDRVIDPSSPQIRELNEQAMMLKVSNLNAGQAKAAYKNIYMDLREYKRMNMFVHAASIPGEASLQNDELRAFIRLGTDFTNNYYEYEIPLAITPSGNYNNESEDDRKIVWPNEFDIELDLFPELKIDRNKLLNEAGSSISLNMPYSKMIDGNLLTIKGNPNLGEVVTIMVGVRNIKDGSVSSKTLSAEVWINELRLTHFRQEGGWAASGRVSTQLADFANISVSGFTSKPGFGSIEKKTSERSKEENNQVDLSSNIYLGKFFPEKSGVRIPMYVGYSRSWINPQYDPLNQDVLFSKSLESIPDDEREDYKRMTQDVTIRRSINFTNVGISKASETPNPLSPNNFTLGYSYRDKEHYNMDVVQDLETQQQLNFAYQYTARPQNVQPFRNTFRKPQYRILRDINFFYQPSMIGFRTTLNKYYRVRETRNLNPYYEFTLPPTVQKDFLWNREYQVKYDLSRSIKFDFFASNYARIDDPYPITPNAEINNYYDELWNEIKGFGRNTQYHHNHRITYTLPINKLRILNWTTSNLSYSGNYTWNRSPEIPDIEGQEINLGNTISNSSSMQLSTNFNMTTLYNKANYLKNINQLYRTGKRRTQEMEDITWEEKGVRLRANRANVIFHRQNIEKPEVWVTDASGDEVKGELKIINNNRIEFTPEKTVNNATIKIEGKSPPQINPLVLIAERTLLTLMGFKNISVTYSLDGGNTLPGFMGEHQYMGIDYKPKGHIDNPYHTPGGTAPDFNYISGWQHRKYNDWPNHDVERFMTDYRGWLSGDENIFNTINFNNNQRLTTRGTFEPLTGLRFDLNAMHSVSENQVLNYFPMGPVEEENPELIQGIYDAITLINGNFSISTISISSAFENPNSSNDYESEAFENFKIYRADIATRMTKEKYPTFEDASPTDTLGYSIYSTEVLMASFYAAYTGTEPEKMNLSSPIMNWYKMRPNWQMRYNRLTDIELLKKYFRTINLSHGYISNYSIGSYITNTDYIGNQNSSGESLEDFITNNPHNLTSNTVSNYDYSNVSISEQFRPLIGVDITLLNNLTARFQIRKTRNLSLSFSNNRLTETKSEEYVFGTGYRFDNVKINLGRPLESDINVSADFTLRDNKTLLRDLEDDIPTQPSTGQKTMSIKLSADYAISNNFIVRIFYDHTRNTPLISNAYPTRNTNVGFSLRVALTQ